MLILSIAIFQWRRAGSRGPSSSTPGATVFVQLALRWRRSWAAQWHLARAVGKRFRGCRAKRLYVDFPPLSTLSTDEHGDSDHTRNARAPTSPRSTGSCAIWGCV